MGTLLATLAAAALTSCTKKTDEKDNTLNVVLKANVKGLDPMSANDLYSSTVIEQMFEGLLQYSYLKRPFQLEPALADGMPTVSADGLVHTFKIKSGVRFQDDPCFKDGKGRELEADDFVYSWRRLADPSNLSDGFWIFKDKVKGFNEWAKAIKEGKADYSTTIEGFRMPDKRTLVITLVKPYYQLDYVLAMPFSMVVPKEAVAKYGKEFLNHPVGTGPYQLESWIRNSKIVMKRNPTWRGANYPTEGDPGDREAGLLEDAGKPMPFADRLVMTELVEDSPRWQNFQKGNFDFAEIPADAFENAVKNKKVVPALEERGVKLHVKSGDDTTYAAFNMKDPILGKNKDLRHAIALAQDVPTFIRNFYNGRATAAQSPIPPDFASYDAAFVNPWQRHDIEKAKELLAKAGYPGGKGLAPLNYETLSDSKSRQQAELFVQDVAKIGIKAVIIANTWPQHQEKIKSQKAQIFAIAWAADYSDPQNFYQLFYTKNMTPGPNDSNFSNAGFDALYEQSLTLAPGPERNALYVKLRDILVDEAPWMFIGHREIYRTYFSWLHNFKPNDLAKGWMMYLRVDPKARAEMKPKL